MKYDFETLIDRRNKGGAKWSGIDDNFPKGAAPLSVADLDMKMCPEIQEGLIEFLKNDPVLGYTEPTQAYYDAVINWLDKHHDYKIEKDWIVLSAGIVPALYDAVAAFTKENDGIIVLNPVYYPFYGAIKENNRKLVECPLINENNSYHINFELLNELASHPDNKLMIFCSPHNPVGRVWTKEELEKVAQICLDNHIILISDEIHEDLTMPGVKHIPIASLNKELEDNMVTCTAPSKSFNLAGLQGSNIIIKNKELRETFKKQQASKGFFSLNTISYEATRLAYTKGEAWLEELKALIAHNYQVISDYIKENLPKAVVYPLEGTYLVWVDFNGYGYDYKTLERKMQEAYVYLDEGYVFGDVGQGYERFNIACPTQVLVDALERIKEVL